MGIRYLRLLVVVGVFCAFFAAGASAQSDATPPVAAVTGNQLTLYNINGGAQQVASGWITNLAWSWDGQALVFTLNNGSMLMLTTRDGGTPVTLAHNVALLPATFTHDGQVVYAVEGTQDEMTTSPNGAPQALVRVFSQDPHTPDADPTLLGEFHFGVGCGGGSPYPMDAVYSSEAGFGGKGLTFVYTRFGLLYSTTCAGIGLGLMNTQTGESVTLSTDASRASLSPNGARVVAVRSGVLTLIDLDTGGQRVLPTQLTPDQIAWGDDSTVYYSVRHLLDSPLPLSTAEAQALDARYGLAADGVPQYAVSIHQVSLSGGETQLYRGPGWAVGRMFTSRGALYFSLIPNGEAWVEAAALDLPEHQAVAVTLFRLSPDGTTQEAGRDIGLAAPLP